MNYMQHYYNLIEKALNSPPILGYSENHHIIPRSLGGSDDTDNMVKLTVRAHRLAHLLLCQEYPDQWCSVEKFYINNNPHRPKLKMPRWIRRNIHKNKIRNLKKYRFC